MIAWNSYLGSCEPPDVCGTARLDTLRPLLSAPVALMRELSGPWYDAEATRRCFQGKRVTILGDSSTQETVFDIYHLLAGLHRAHDYTVPDGEEEIHHDQSKRKTITIKVSANDPTVVVSFVGSELAGGHDASRNATVDVQELDTVIRYRWGAGEHIDQNFGGLTELLKGEYSISDVLYSNFTTHHFTPTTLQKVEPCVRSSIASSVFPRTPRLRPRAPARTCL